MSDAQATVHSEKRRAEQPANANAILVLADGTVFWGHGVGLENDIVGEVCFNTSMTGYQEIIRSIICWPDNNFHFSTYWERGNKSR